MGDMLPSESRLPITDEEVIETLYRMLIAGGRHEAASLLRKCRARFEETGYDNWNGGTHSITLYVHPHPMISIEFVGFIMTSASEGRFYLSL
jgi:hypothetical protein